MDLRKAYLKQKFKETYNVNTIQGVVETKGLELLNNVIEHTEGIKAFCSTSLDKEIEIRQQIFTTLIFYTFCIWDGYVKLVITETNSTHTQPTTNVVYTQLLYISNKYLLKEASMYKSIIYSKLPVSFQDQEILKRLNVIEDFINKLKTKPHFHIKYIYEGYAIVTPSPRLCDPSLITFVITALPNKTIRVDIISDLITCLPYTIQTNPNFRFNPQNVIKQCLSVIGETINNYSFKYYNKKEVK